MADSDNLTDVDLLAMAQAADEGREYNPKPKEEEAKVEQVAAEKASGDTDEKPASQESAETKQDASSEAPATEEKSEEAKSSLTTQSEETKSESASEKKPSKYERAKLRLEKEWEDVKAEKARIKAEREAFESERAKGQASQSGSETQKTGNRRFSSEDYRDAAKSYREEGRDDLAKLAEEKATQIETEDRQEFERKTQEELRSAWDKNLAKEVDENPDLKDSNSKLYKAVSEMLQNHAILRNYPAGISDAVGIAKVKLKAEAASDLEKRVAEYERELAQLRKATTPAKGQPSSPAKKKEFHQLSLDEQEQELLRMAAEADRG